MPRSLQSLLPFLLATLGHFVVLLAFNMPLLDWQITEFTTDFPATYKVNISPSPWTAYFGNTLDDGSYIFNEVSVKVAGQDCSRKDFHFVVQRSRNDEILERVFNIHRGTFLQLETWAAIGTLAYMVYIWLFTIWHEPRTGCVYAVFFTAFAGAVYLLVSQIARPFIGPFAGHAHILDYDRGKLACHGTVTFQAELSKIYYDTSLLFFVGIGLGLGALGLVLYQIIRAVREAQKGSTPAGNWNSPE